MLIKRLTKNAQSTIETARQASHQSQLKEINIFFLINAILKQRGCLGKLVLESRFSSKKQPIANKKITASVFDALVKAGQIALQTRSPFIGTEHLAQACLSFLDKIKTPKKRSASTAHVQSTPPYHLLSLSPFSEQSSSSKNYNPFSSSDFLSDPMSFFSQFLAPAKKAPSRSSVLENFCTDLNQQAIQQRHVLVGRKREIDRISNILGRKMKNNPVLIGDPGVGKTAIIEGLARQISQGKAPFYLHNKKIMSLDLGLLVAGTTFRGEFEARLKEVINEAKRHQEIILFIDEIHNLVGAGNAIGGMDAANLLKPALSRGEIQVIGATTFEEYRKHIEKDSALERRLQPVVVKEPSFKETVAILKGVTPYYESFHNVTIPASVIPLVVKLAIRYLRERRLPDSALDLIDETAARVRSKSSATHLYEKIKHCEEKLQILARRKEELIMLDRFEEALRTRQEETRLIKEYNSLQKKLASFEKKHPIVLRSQHLKETVSLVSQVPLELLSEENRSIPLQVKKIFKHRLVGQPHAQQKIVNTLLRRVSGVSSPHKPLGSFLFIGPSGVGKTFTAKLLARAIAPGENPSLIQLNMSEFMEKHTVSRLLGAPAGYVGYEEIQKNSEKIRKNPFSVVLFDEIEKAERAVLNLLLQILDEGKITDSKGREIDFTNAIIVLTSNIGLEELNKLSEIGFAADKKSLNKIQRTESLIQEELETTLAPELLNRLDQTIIYRHLSPKDIQKIVKQKLALLAKRAKEKGLTVSFTPAAIKKLTEKSFNPLKGARLVENYLKEEIEPLVAEQLLTSSRKTSSKIKITYSGEIFRLQS